MLLFDTAQSNSFHKIFPESDRFSIARKEREKEMKTIAIEDMEKVSGGSIGLKNGITREEQEAMVRRHFLEKKKYRWDKESAIQAEIEFNANISNTLLTSDDIIRIATEIFG